MDDSKRQASFPKRVYAVVKTVPDGAITTYGDVAAALGNPRLARQVGWALAALPSDTDVPWQRVINSKGAISFRGEFGRAEEQRRRLASEGVDFDESGRCDLEDHRWWFPDLRTALDPDWTLE
jgi:methylated-DNA-protein-cysteine methyltransferase-like protein